MVRVVLGLGALPHLHLTVLERNTGVIMGVVAVMLRINMVSEQSVSFGLRWTAERE